MRIIHDHPPNFDQIIREFPRASGRGVLFAYDDAIYVPDGAHVPPELIAHEEAHMRQQRIAGGPEVWWDQYIKSKSFRLKQ